MLSTYLADIRKIRDRDPAARSALEVALTYSGLHAIVYYRIAHFFHTHKLRFIARCISQFARAVTGIEIHPGAVIGNGVFIDHGMGVVIGETAVVGDDCILYQGVTLGGTGKDIGKRHPTIGNNVLIGAGAKVLGPFYVGDNSKIAANAVLLRALPANATAVGVPAKIAKVGNVKVSEMTKCTVAIDHVLTPDPVAQELCRLRRQICLLERRLAVLDGQEIPDCDSDDRC